MSFPGGHRFGSKSAGLEMATWRSSERRFCNPRYPGSKAAQSCKAPLPVAHMLQASVRTASNAVVTVTSRATSVSGMGS